MKNDLPPSCYNLEGLTINWESILPGLIGMYEFRTYDLNTLMHSQLHLQCNVMNTIIQSKIHLHNGSMYHNYYKLRDKNNGPLCNYCKPVQESKFCKFLAS